MLTLNQAAPDFTLSDTQNIAHSLTDYQGKWLILFFYPKDNTPHCTKEACSFRDDYSQFGDLNAQIIGINTNNNQSHLGFTEKHQLPFTLLSDPQGKVSALYGALFKLGPLKYSKRHSFLIDPKGILVKIYRDVKAESHTQELLQDLNTLQKIQ